MGAVPSFAPLPPSGWRLDVIAPPARLFGANGLRVGPDGRLYLPQVLTGEVVSVDPDRPLVAERGRGRATWLSGDGGHQEVVATDLPLGMPQPGLRPGRRASLLAEATGSVLMGCDGDGGIRRPRRG